MLGLLGAAGATPATAKTAPARISVETSPYLYGYVDSPLTGCDRKRTVSVLRVLPGKDRRVARSTTRKFKLRWQWSTVKDLSGRFYVTAAAKPGCKPAKSKVVTRTPIGDEELPTCPSTRDMCFLASKDDPTIYLSDTFEDCKSFTASSDSCDGASRGDPSGWTGSNANFHWNTYSGGIKLAALYEGDAFFEGSVPAPNSNKFTVRSAKAHDSTTRWCTPDLAGVAAGEKGGPLNFNFKNVGSTFFGQVEVFLYGYMKKAPC
ncbi:MAG: hypothetical protein ACSLFD_06840 [Solirubrobacterales bacterium]